MNLADGRLAAAPGTDGLVCRTPGAVLFVAARTPVADVARLVDAVRAQQDPQPAHALARQLAALVAAEMSTTLPGFALVAASPGGVYVKVYGAVEVHLQGEGGEEVISAVGSFTGVDRELPSPFHTIAAHRAGEPTPGPAFDVDMQSGTSAGGGFALTVLAEPTAAVPAAPPPSAPPAAPMSESVAPPPEAETDPYTASASTEAAAAEAAPAAANVDVPTEAWTPPAEDVDPPPAPVAAPSPPPLPTEPPTDPTPVVAPPVYEPPAAVTPPAYEPPATPMAEPATLPPAAVPDVGGGGFTSQLLGALDEDEAEAREPLPTEPDPGEVRAADQQTSEVMVQGVVCSRGHFNDPRSRFCSSCGISMVQNTQILTQGPRPPLGVIVFEDGATFSLATDYVVGRQPESSPLVQSGEALPLPVDDPERSISRAHAELRLVDWDVHLVNLSETNGSFVWDPTSNQWIPIPAGQSVMLTPGMRVALGRRSAVFESSLVR